MPDPVVDPNVAPPIADNAPVIDTPPPPPPEPADEHGVPYKNRLAEYQRKLDEANSLNQQYQQVLGSYTQQQQQQQPRQADVTAKFDAETVNFVKEVARQVAQETGHKMMTQAQLQDALSDPDLVNAARPIYIRLKNSPMWSNADDLLVQDRALTEAKFTMSEQRQTASRQAQSQQLTHDANRSQAGNANLPVASGGAPIAPQTDAAVTAWMNDPDKRKLFRSLYPQMDINSPDGLAKFKKIATRAVEER